MARRLGLLLAIFVIPLGVLRAQGTTSQPKEIISNGGLMHTLMAAPVIGQPYSAVQVSQLVRTLADGTTIRKGPGPGHGVLRDSSGRVRVEKWIVRAQNGDSGLKMIFVYDPNERVLTTWSMGDKAEKSALEIRLPAENPANSAAQSRPKMANSARPQPLVTVEQLRTEMIDGVAVDPVKTTTIVPAGRSGNDAAITKTHEVWTSPDLKLILKEQWNDPRSGEITLWLKDFSRAEPDSAMFRAPQGYRVKTLKESIEELRQKLGDAEGQM